MKPRCHRSAAQEEKDWLVGEIEDIAAWLTLKVGTCCGTPRSVGSVQSLHALAAAVRDLPVSDPLFAKLAHMTQTYMQNADISGLGDWLNETKSLLSTESPKSDSEPEDLIRRLLVLTDDYLSRKQPGCPSRAATAKRRADGEGARSRAARRL
jgi:hypothetical protein